MPRILLVQKTFLEMFGVMSISSFLKSRGHDTCVSIETGGRLLKAAEDFRPDVIGFSAVSMNVHANLAEAGMLKKNFPGAPIVFGGVHATFFPELVDIPQVDAVCRGEGEYPLAEFTEAHAAGSSVALIPNLWVKSGGQTHMNPLRPPIENLDELPFPDRDSYYTKYAFLRNNPVKNFLCSRGCPFSCSFCFNETYRALYSECGHRLATRMRSPESVIAEIEDFRAKWPLERLAFQDENICLDKKWLFRFLEQYSSKVRLPFFCMINASVADEDMVSALKAAGCHHTTFGVESGDENLRRNILKKKVSDEQIRKTAALLHRHGITFHTTNIFCFPEENFESAVKTLKLNAEIAPDSTIAFKFMPFANLELTGLAVRKGYLTAQETSDWKRLPGVTVRMPDTKRILRLMLMFGAGVRRPGLIPAFIFLSRLPVGFIAGVLFHAVDAVSYFSRNRHNMGYMIANISNLRRLYKSYIRE